MRTSAALLSLALCCSASAQLIDPEGPLVRAAGIYRTLTYELTVKQTPSSPMKPVVFPLIVDGPWNVVDPTSLQVEVWEGGQHVLTKTATDLGKPDALGVLDISLKPDNAGFNMPLQLRITANEVVYAADLDESVAGQIPWPVAWPSPARTFMQPGPLIESTNALVKQAVEATVGPDPRQWAPPLAVAKRLIQASCTNWTSNGSHIATGPESTMRGVNVSGAVAALTNGGGSDSDLVCLCVAVLRAAGLPARPVLALGADKSDQRDSYYVYGEFFLPEAGWVPFQPDLLRGRGVANKQITQQWRGLGHCPHLDDLVPLFWTFGPPQEVYEAFAGWTWSPLVPGAVIPLPMTTGSVQVGNETILTGRRNNHSSIFIRSANTGRPKEPVASPWRGSQAARTP